MCGAFAFYTAGYQYDFLDGKVRVVWTKRAKEFESYNIRPTQNLVALANTETPEANLYRFGVTPVFNDKALWFNTRDDKLLSGKGYWQQLRNKRCIVLANGFYEWQGTKSPKQPHYIQVKDTETFALAGLWNSFEKDGETVRHATIITTSPNDLLAPIHDRMPVILHPESIAGWLNPEKLELVEIGSYLQPYPADEMMHHPVSRDVGPVANDYAELISPRD